MIALGTSERLVRIPAGRGWLRGTLSLPTEAIGVVAFAHGRGSSEYSPQHQALARSLHQLGLGTLLFDLLTDAESAVQANLFNMALLADRLLAATEWLGAQPETAGLPLGYFGASTGAGAALIAAAQAGPRVSAVVSRNGRPDLARMWLAEVQEPTLLIVGGLDTDVLEVNRLTLARLRCRRGLAVLPGARHLFEDEGALALVSRLAADWFARYLRSRDAPDTGGG